MHRPFAEADAALDESAARMEAEIAKLDEELAANACDYEKYSALYAKKEELDEQLLALMERWT